MTRYLTFDDAHTLAIDYKWFTKADNDIYYNWLCHFEAIDNLTDKEILKAACIVYKYSVFDYDNNNKNDIINHICFLIANKAITMFDFNTFEIKETENTIK